MNRSKATSYFTDTNILLLLGLALFLLHMVTNHQYGFHQDELVVLDNANNLDWGFVEYPPLTPFLARIELTLFGLSLVGARTLPALVHGIVLVLTGLMARDLGAGRRAQVLAAIAAAIAPFGLILGSLIQYVTFDYLWSVLIAYLVIRLLKSEDPRWWLAIGTVIGLGMMTKYTTAFFAAGLVVGVLLTDGFYDTLTVNGQIRHDFISIEFLSSIHARDVEIGRADGYLVEQFLLASNPFVVPLWVAGLIYYFRNPGGKRYRMIGWMYLIPFLIYLFTQGRSYYQAAAYPMLFAAGAVVWQGWLERMSARGARIIFAATWIFVMMGTVVAGALSLPIAPINSPLWNTTSEVHDIFTEQIGWHEMVQTVGGIYANLPEEDKPNAGILAGENDEAAALNLYGGRFDLPKAISGSDTFWLRGYESPPPETLIVVGLTREHVDSLFETCAVAGTVTNAYGVENDLRSPPDIFVCRDPRFPWDELWDRLKRYS